MTKITVSYRRNDSDAITGRIFDRLVAHYGVDTVFRDIDNIPPGIDYRKYINEALASTDILLAIVGPQWTGKTTDGNIRIRQPTDLVRIEVETALRRDIPVVPVLVGHAIMPQPTDLPDGLQDFAFRHAVKVDAQEDFDDHVRRLIRSLDRLLQTRLSSVVQDRVMRNLDEVLQAPLEDRYEMRAAKRQTLGSGTKPLQFQGPRRWFAILAFAALCLFVAFCVYEIIPK